MKKINTVFVITTFLVIIACNIGMLGMHYASDTYNLIKLGFSEYAMTWFVPAGRFVGALIMFTFEILNVELFQYIIIMQGIAIIASTVSIYLLYNTILKIYKEQANFWDKLLIFFTSIITIVNNGSYQYFYYAESGVMWLSVLFTILAIRMIAIDKPKKYMKIFFLLLFAVNCYQASVLIFIPIIIVIIFYKNDSKIRASIMEIIKCILILILCMIINYALIIILKQLFCLSTYRKNDNININIPNILFNFREICYFFNDGFPMYIKTTYIVVFITVVQYLKDKYFKYDKLKSFLILILLVISSIFPVTLIIGCLDFYLGDRIIYSYTSIIGLSLIYLILFLNLYKWKTFVKTIACIVLAIISIITIWNFNNITENHLKANQKDKQIAIHIGKMIDNYQEESGIKIKKIIYCYDDEHQFFHEDLRKGFEATVRAIGADWCFENVIFCFTNKNLDKNEDETIHESIFYNKNWNKFSEEQIVFLDNTMYYCIY